MEGGSADAKLGAVVVKEEQVGEKLLERVAEYLPEQGQELVREALAFATEKHAGQLRKNGDPVITHPLHAAETIAGLQLDAEHDRRGAAARRPGGLRTSGTTRSSGASGTKWR